MIRVMSTMSILEYCMVKLRIRGLVRLGGLRKVVEMSDELNAGATSYLYLFSVTTSIEW